MLERHLQSPAGAVRSIEVRVRRRRDRLDVRYVVEGDLDRIVLPAPQPPRSAARLWEHTCCELFVARKGAPAYEELNFSPSGEWARFVFSDYRSAAPGVNGAPPDISVRREPSRLVLEAHVPLRADGALELGLSAVIEEQGGAVSGAFSYWALRHPPGRPDFHHRDAFAMELDEVRD